MKTYQISVDGHEYTVEIDDPNASPVRVVVDGKTFAVTVSQQGTQVAARPTPRGSEAITDPLLDAYVPAVASTYVEVAPEPEPVDAPQPAADAQTVTAPMPGMILDIVVQAGDSVQQGDTLCNLEAMKMKSPIHSPTEGTIAQILINEGQNVAYGDILFTIR